MKTEMRPDRATSAMSAMLAGLSLSGCMALPADPDHEPHDWKEEPHHLSMLVAGTFEQVEAAPSIGVDYEYRLNPFLGIGAVAERAFGEIETTTLIGAADLHFTDHLIAQIGPGIEFVRGEQEPMFRIGMLYEFEQHGYTISPQLHYDWTSGEDAIVFGLAFGVGF